MIKRTAPVSLRRLGGWTMAFALSAWHPRQAASPRPANSFLKFFGDVMMVRSG